MSDYLVGLDAPERDVIERIRARAVSLVPEAVEGMSYGMPDSLVDRIILLRRDEIDAAKRR